MCHTFFFPHSLALAQTNSILLLWDQTVFYFFETVGKTWRPYWFFHSINFHHNVFEYQRITSLQSTKGPLKYTPVWHRGSFRSGGKQSSVSCPLLHTLGHRPTALLFHVPSPKANLTSAPVKLDYQVVFSFIYFFHSEGQKIFHI